MLEGKQFKRGRTSNNNNNNMASNLEPIDGAAVDERREFTQAVAESFSDRTHGEHDVKLLLATVCLCLCDQGGR